MWSAVAMSTEPCTPRPAADSTVPTRAACSISWASHTDQAVVAAAFDTADLRLLREAKARVDPRNLFRINHNIAPLTKG